MIYSIEWNDKTSFPGDSNIPKFVFIDSLPLRDEESNIYTQDIIYHINPNDYSELHRRKYPDCFTKIIEKSFPGWEVKRFHKSSIIEIEDYIEKRRSNN